MIFPLAVVAFIGLTLSTSAGEPVTVDIPKPPKSYVQDCAVCPQLKMIPNGSFIMGAREYDKDAYPIEGPAQTVTIERPFYMGRFEVTRAEYAVCVDAGACRAREDAADEPFDQFFYPVTPGHPVENVTWEDAQSYVVWLSKKTNHVYRIPTEAEWEYAARGGTATINWWGDEVSSTYIYCPDCRDHGKRKPSPDREVPFPVGLFRENPFGLHDMMGNVREWTSDCWHKDLTYVARQTPSSAESCKHVIRGASYRSSLDRIRTSVRIYIMFGEKMTSTGFRVLREISSANR